MHNNGILQQDDRLLRSLGLSSPVFDAQSAMLRVHSRSDALLCMEVIDYLANTLIFVISGNIIAGKIYAGLQSGSPYIFTGRDYGWAVALWLLLLVMRPFFLFMCMFPSSSFASQWFAFCLSEVPQTVSPAL